MARKRSNKRATAKARSRAQELLTKYFYPLDNARDEYVDRWIDLYKRYEGYLEERTDEDAWKANLPDFFTFPFVHAMTAFLHNAFFGAKPYISVGLYTHGADYSEEELRKKRAIEQTINQQFDECKFSSTKGIVTLSDANLYGTAIARVYWNEERVARTIVEGGDKIFKEVTIFDGPDVTPVKLWDFWVDPMVSDISKADVVISRSIISIDHFDYLVRTGVFDDVDVTPVTEDDIGVSESREVFTEVDEQTVAWLDPNKVELLEIWTKGYGEPGKVYYVANRAVLVAERDNWFWSNSFPFVVFRPIPVSGKFYGISPIWVARGAIDEIMTHKRLRMDNIKLHLMPMWKATGAINPEDLKVRPEGIIWCETRGDDVEPFRVNYVGVGVDEEERLVQAVQFILGFSELMAGIAPQTSIFRTAVGATTFANIAFGRLGLIKASIAEGVSNVASKFVELDYQYLTEEISLMLEDGEEMLLEAEAMADVKKLVPVAALDPNKQMRRQQFINMLQVLAQTPLVKRLNWEAVWKELVYDMDFQNEETLLLLPEGEAPQFSPQIPGSLPENINPQSAALQELMRASSQGGGNE